jgi:hypothetical protein
MKLSMVRILPRAADHMKMAALKGTLVHHTLFQGKWQPSLQTREKDLILNNTLLEGTHSNLSLLPHLILTDHNT